MPEWSPTVKRAWSYSAPARPQRRKCGRAHAVSGAVGGTVDPPWEGLPGGGLGLGRKKLLAALELALAWGYYWSEVCDSERRPWNWVKAIEYDIPQPQSRLRTSDSMVSPQESRWCFGA
jgi:hypothetical protein